MLKIILSIFISFSIFAIDCAKDSDLVKFEDSIYVFSDLEQTLEFNSRDVKALCNSGDIIVVTNEVSDFKSSAIKASSFIERFHIRDILLLFLILNIVINSLNFMRVSCALFTISALVITGLRFASTGFFPIFSIYDTVWISINICAILSVWFGFRSRSENQALYLRLLFILISIFMSLLAFFPNVFISHVKTPMPVLRDNFWLMTHVSLMIISYTLLAISWLCATLNLFASKKFKIEEGIISQTVFAGTALLAFGIFLGAIWADKAWGRFWAWDPKETWSLVTLCVYSITFHLTKVKETKFFQFNLLISLCFTGVLMTWFGVNFVFASGLHSYGFSEGGIIIFSGFLVVQSLNILNFYRLRKI